MRFSRYYKIMIMREVLEVTNDWDGWWSQNGLRGHRRSFTSRQGTRQEPGNMYKELAHVQLSTASLWESSVPRGVHSCVFAHFALFSSHLGDWHLSSLPFKAKGRDNPLSSNSTTLEDLAILGIMWWPSGWTQVESFAGWRGAHLSPQNLGYGGRNIKGQSCTQKQVQCQPGIQESLAQHFPPVTYFHNSVGSFPKGFWNIIIIIVYQVVVAHTYNHNTQEAEAAGLWGGD